MFLFFLFVFIVDSLFVEKKKLVTETEVQCKNGQEPRGWSSSLVATFSVIVAWWGGVGGCAIPLLAAVLAQRVVLEKTNRQKWGIIGLTLLLHVRFKCRTITL